MLRKLQLLALICFLLDSCSFTEKIRDGKTAMERKQYHVAIPLLEKEFRKEKSIAEKGAAAYMLGTAFEKSGRRDESVFWYKTAIENRYGADAYRAYAQGLKFQEQYKEAIQAFKALGVEIVSNYEVKKDIIACENALKWQLELPQNGFWVKTTPFNSSFDDYAPALYGEGQLVFTSDRGATGSRQRYKWTGRSFSDFYIADAVNNTVKNYAAQINATENEGAATFNAERSLMIFSRSFSENKGEDAFMKLFSATREGALWGSPRELGFCRNNVNYWHPTLSADGKKLFFSMCDPENSSGFDLYYTVLGENGEWSEPIALPKNINSLGDEIFPTLHGDTLFFSSNYLPGMGGFDIFRTHPLKTSWLNPQNLKAPINSGADDLSFVVDRFASLQKDELLKGYFCSNRRGGAGGDDIYHFVKKVQAPVVTDSLKPAVKKKETVAQQIWLSGYVVEKIYQNADDPNSKVIGKKTLGTVPINVEFGKEKLQIVSNEDGFFSLQLLENHDYLFLAKKEDYLSKSITLSTHNLFRDAEEPILRLEIELELERIFKNKEIVMKNIYYDFDKAEVRDDAKPTLNELAAVLFENQTIRIRLNSHTDCQGNEAYNEDLSQRRAQSAVDYLISLGIPASRLQAKGFGESQPAVRCDCSQCTDVENQTNRRTTFTILDDDQ